MQLQGEQRGRLLPEMLRLGTVAWLHFRKCPRGHLIELGTQKPCGSGEEGEETLEHL